MIRAIDPGLICQVKVGGCALGGSWFMVCGVGGWVLTPTHREGTRANDLKGHLRRVIHHHVY